MRINKTVVRGSHHVNCPHCHQSVLTISEKESICPDDKPYLQDGDTVFGLWELLSEEQKALLAFEYGVMVGCCQHCDEGYFNVSLTLMKGEYKDVQHYLRWNDENMKQQSASLCQVNIGLADGSLSWVLTEHSTADGIMQEHQFGLWKLEDTDLVDGDLGYVGCQHPGNTPNEQGKLILSTLWDDLTGMYLSKFVQV